MNHAERLPTGRGPVATNVEHEMDMTEQYHPSINRFFFSFTHAGKKRVASLTPNRKTWHIHYESRTDTTSSRLDALTARTQVSTKYQTHSLIHGILTLKVPHSSPVGRVSSTAAAPSIFLSTSDFESRSISKICLDVVPFGWHVRKMIVEKSSVNDCQQLSWRSFNAIWIGMTLSRNVYQLNYNDARANHHQIWISSRFLSILVILVIIFVLVVYSIDSKHWVVTVSFHHFAFVSHWKLNNDEGRKFEFIRYSSTPYWTRPRDFGSWQTVTFISFVKIQRITT